MRKRRKDGVVLVIDHFLKNPEAIFQAAVRADYQKEPDRLPGFRSVNFLKIPEVIRLAGGMGFQSRDVKGCFFQYFPEGPKSYIHVDPKVLWTGLIFLSKNPRPRSGTSFYRHRKTGIEEYKLEKKWLLENRQNGAVELLEQAKYRFSQWEEVLHVPERFNRLILFDPLKFHMNTKRWGKTAKDSRLTCNFRINRMR